MLGVTRDRYYSSEQHPWTTATPSHCSVLSWSFQTNEAGGFCLLAQDDSYFAHFQVSLSTFSHLSLRLHPQGVSSVLFFPIKKLSFPFPVLQHFIHTPFLCLWAFFFFSVVNLSNGFHIRIWGWRRNDVEFSSHLSSPRHRPMTHR